MGSIDTNMKCIPNRIFLQKGINALYIPIVTETILKPVKKSQLTFVWRKMLTVKLKIKIRDISEKLSCLINLLKPKLV